MKKFFRLVSVLAIAGATFAYTGCTDYSDDIDKVNDRVDDVENTIAGIEKQITGLESTVQGLNAAMDAANASIKDLQDDLAGLGAKHDADVKNINAAIDAAKKSITALEGRVKSIEDELPTFAKKSWVEATFATKAQMTAANEEIGKLAGRLQIVENKLPELSAAITKNATDIDAANKRIAANEAAIAKAQAAADAAQATASEALGKVNTLIDALGVYAEKGKLEAKIEALEEMDEDLAEDIADLDEKKLNIADFQGKFDVAFDAAIKEAVKDNGVVGKVINEKVEAARKALQAQIDVLNTKVNKIFGLFEGRITNLTIVPEAYCGGVPVIDFTTLYYTYKNNSYWSSKDATVRYRIAPKAAGIDGADFDFVGDKAFEHNAVMSDARAFATAPKAPIAIAKVPNAITFDAKTGYATFVVEKIADFRNQYYPQFGAKSSAEVNPTDFDIVALEATIAENLLAEGEKDAKVYSEYAKVEETTIDAENLYVSDKALLKAKKACHYVQTLAEAKNLKSGDVGFYTFDYDKVWNLKALVATCLHGAAHADFNIEDYDLYYDFSIEDYDVVSGGTETEQQHMFAAKKGSKSTDGLFVTVDKDGKESSNKESLGRTPIVKVMLKHEDRIVREGFVKVLVTVEHDPDINILDITNTYTSSLCYDVKHHYEINEKRMWEEIYQHFNMSHPEFWSHYNFKEAIVKVNGTVKTGVPAPKLIEGVDSEGRATKKVTWDFVENDFGCVPDKGMKLEAELVLENNLMAYSDLPAYIKFKFAVDVAAPDYTLITKTFKQERLDKNFWDGETLIVNVAVPADKNDIADNCQFNTPFQKAPWKVAPTVDFSKYKCYSGIHVQIKSVSPANAKDGVYLSTYAGEQSIALDKTNANVKKALDANNLSAVIEYYLTGPCGELSLFTFPVEFIKPVNFALPEGLTVEDAQDGGDPVADFDYLNLFTDWRGYPVYPALEDVRPVQRYGWVRTSGPKFTWLPARQEVVTEGHYEFTFEDVAFPYSTTEADDEGVTPETKLKTITLTVGYSSKTYSAFKRSLFGLGLPQTKAALEAVSDYKTYTFTATALTVDQAKNMIMRDFITSSRFSNDLYRHLFDGEYECGIFGTYSEVTETTVGGAVDAGDLTVVENYIYIPMLTDIQWVEGEYETIPAQWVIEEPVTPRPRAGRDYPRGTQLTEGYTIGSWTWTRLRDGSETFVAREQSYWDFYGEFSEIVLDLSDNYKNVTTDLNTGKLPSTVTLTQVGNTVVFHNNGSPVMEPYHIYIPAKVTYGWGTLTDTLVITVLPLQN